MIQKKRYNMNISLNQFYFINLFGYLDILVIKHNNDFIFPLLQF